MDPMQSGVKQAGKIIWSREMKTLTIHQFMDRGRAQAEHRYKKIIHQQRFLSGWERYVNHYYEKEI